MPSNFLAKALKQARNFSKRIDKNIAKDKEIRAKDAMNTKVIVLLGTGDSGKYM
jgi:uncharacterized phosphosugar-binding protein